MDLDTNGILALALIAIALIFLILFSGWVARSILLWGWAATIGTMFGTAILIIVAGIAMIFWLLSGLDV